jgi:hypothetical protein
LTSASLTPKPHGFDWYNNVMNYFNDGLEIDDGVPIPNFNDGSVGAPDCGVHEDGTPDTDFGPAAWGG